MNESRRKGFTLVELMLALTMLSFVLAMVAGLLHTLIKVDRSGRDWLAASTRWSRAAERFRDDAHAARRVESTPEGLRLGEVEYRASAEGLTRSAGSRRETIVAGPGASFVLGTEGAFATLTYRRPSGPKGDPVLRSQTVATAVGRDHRFETVKEGP